MRIHGSAEITRDVTAGRKAAATDNEAPGRPTTKHLIELEVKW